VLIEAGDRITALGKDRLTEIDDWAYKLAKRFAPREDKNGDPYWKNPGDEARFDRYLELSAKCALALPVLKWTWSGGPPGLCHATMTEVAPPVASVVRSTSMSRPKAKIESRLIGGLRPGRMGLAAETETDEMAHL